MITYSNAKNKIGTIVNIDKVTEESRHEQYFCIGCEKEMVPVLGDKREHHFRHKEDCECNGETYLHNYAKNYIKQVFDTSKEFYISYQIPEICCNHNNCKYRRDEPYVSIMKSNCGSITKTKYDIKKYYDTCELESKYNDFIADLKIYNKKNPDREPIFIEIAVTHKCEKEKTNSNIKIIEISIPKSLNDLSIIGNSLRETQNHEDKQINIKFYNFKRKEHDSQKPFNFHSYSSYIINKNKKLQCCTHDKCSEYGNVNHSHSLFEVHSFYHDYDIVCALINLKKQELKNCYVCKNYWKTWLGENRCNENKIIKSPSQALECLKYKYSEFKAKRLSFGFTLEKGLAEGVYCTKRCSLHIKKEEKNVISVETLGKLTISMINDNTYIKEVYKKEGKVYGDQYISIKDFDKGHYLIDVGGEYPQNLIIY